MRKKKSALFYFDNYHLISDLPDAQMGILFRALMEFGELEADGRDGSPAFKRYSPSMSEKTQMAFAFMADNVRRDTVAYREKCANYSAAAQKREERRAPQSQATAEAAAISYASALMKEKREAAKQAASPDSQTT